jgi:hypothetical protein
MSARVCACGCGRSIEGSSRRLYLDGHRDRAYRRRLAATIGAEALTVKAVEAAVASKPSLDPNPTVADAQGAARQALLARPQRKRTPRAGVSLYFPTIELAEAAATRLEGEAKKRLLKAITRRKARIRKEL